jgi:hypothetical protein
MSFENDEAATQELKLYTENDGNIYKSQTTYILKNLATKKVRGTYDREKAVDLFMYLTETGAKKYVKEFGSPRDVWHEMFPTSVRREVAAAWRDEFETEYDLGNYDHLLPKKYQKTTSPHYPAKLSLIKTEDGTLYLQGTGDPSQHADFSIFQLDGEGGDPFALGNTTWEIVPNVKSFEYDPNDNDTFWSAHGQLIKSARKAKIKIPRWATQVP